ncbi:unnamed protein product, partial [Timema podura]|nr:unnamed protein product [Timema podura]
MQFLTRPQMTSVSTLAAEMTMPAPFPYLTFPRRRAFNHGLQLSLREKTSSQLELVLLEEKEVTHHLQPLSNSSPRYSMTCCPSLLPTSSPRYPTPSYH